MADLFENPVGLDGFEFVEFCAPEKGVLEPVFQAMGFTHVANHRSKDVQLWRQGGINLITNYEPMSAAWYFAREHGPSACGMGFRVKDASQAWAKLMDAGAEPVDTQTGPMELSIPAIKGIGGALIASMLANLFTTGVVSFHELMITLFLFLTAPITAHFIAKVHLHLNEPRDSLPPTGTETPWAGAPAQPEDPAD